MKKRIKREELNEKQKKHFFGEDWSEWKNLDVVAHKRGIGLDNPGIYEQSVVFQDKENNENRIVIYLGKAGGFKKSYRNKKTGIFLTKKEKEKEEIDINRLNIKNPENYEIFYQKIKNTLLDRFLSYQTTGSHLKIFHNQIKKCNLKIEIRYKIITLNPNINNKDDKEYGIDNIKLEESKYLIDIDYILNIIENNKRRIEDFNKLLDNYEINVDKIGNKKCILKDIGDVEKIIIKEETKKEHKIKINKTEDIKNLKISEESKEKIKTILEKVEIKKEETDKKINETKNQLKSFKNKKGQEVFIYEIFGVKKYLDSENWVLTKDGEGNRDKRRKKPLF